jgi:SAM-dependent methyltransferase
MASLSPSATQCSELAIESSEQLDCVICGTPGAALYKNLRDGFCGAAGCWNFARCTDPVCGMLWLNPMPLESEIWKAYRNYYTHEDAGAVSREGSSRGSVAMARHIIKRAYVASRLRYNEGEVALRWQALSLLAYLDPTRRADTDFPLKYLPPETRGRLLDLGCGSGELLRRMQSLGWQAEGIDIDPVAAEAARRKGFKVRTGSLHEQKFPDATFDAVVMSHVIEHVHHPRALLSEVRRILKPGRRLVIATPNARSFGHRVLGARWPFLDPPRHLQVFTPYALEALVHAAGFHEVSVRTEIRTAAAMLPLIEASRIAGRLVEYGENLALHFDRDAGEEIAMVAVR